MKIQDYLKSNNAKRIVFISGNYEVRLETEYTSRHNLLFGVWERIENEKTEIDEIQSNIIYIKSNDSKINFTYSGKIVIQ